MSWVKRRGQDTTNSQASSFQQPPQMQVYNNSNQHSAQESRWQQPLPQAPTSNSTLYQENHYQQAPPPQQTNYWPPYNQQLQEAQMYNQNTNQFGKQQQQFVANQGPNNYYQNPTSYQQLQQHQQQQQQNYGNLQYNQNPYSRSNNSPYNQQLQQQQQQQQQQQIGGFGDESDAWNWGWGDEDNSNLQTTNQATTNAIADSFTNDETWNWSLEESNNAAYQQQQQQHPLPQESVFSKMGRHAERHANANLEKKENNESAAAIVEQQLGTNQNMQNVNLDILPSLTTGKRGKVDNLTPQWSIESQVSQESSDDLLHTSESDKSHMLSRSSTISQSPISGQEPNPELGLIHETVSQEEAFVNYERANLKSFVSTQQQQENKEILSNVPVQDNNARLNANVVQPPPMKTPPLSQQMGNNAAGYSVNPYKRNTTVLKDFKQKRYGVSQPEFPTYNQSVNLETVPDNSEQPDSLPAIHKSNNHSGKSPHNNWPENNEVAAPINDRNQYLETGHLSDINNYNNQSEPMNTSQDTEEPPPGLSRMVPGHTGNFSALNRAAENEPPLDFQRMVPGESSSPESSAVLRQQTYARREDDYVSETELNNLNSTSSVVMQQRSATIGADTPPSVMNPVSVSTPQNINRSETIGADTPPASIPSDVEINSRVSGLDVRERSADGENVIDETGLSASTVNSKRDAEIGNLIAPMRDLTVGENTNDEDVSGAALDVGKKRHSRQESSDSEHDLRNQPSRERKDRRYKDDKYEREKDRDSYRDKKYDRRKYHGSRRYEEDTDYYSDKDRDWRSKEERVRRDDYERKYSSLHRDKDKEKRRREKDYAGRENRNRGDYYYSRYEDDYENETRSRPSSRSDSMQDYRERGHERDPRRHRDRERDHHRRHRGDPFSSYMQGYGYDPYNPYYHYQYQYYENLRRTNPQAYAEMYRKYYQQAAAGGQTTGYGAEDRASVHSGRSSANDELAKDSYNRQFDRTDSSLNFEDNNLTLQQQQQRLTPAKFSTAHVKASIESGKLVKVSPNYPIDGQPATVEIINIQALLVNDETYRELMSFPGPLCKGVTHKKTIIEYCESKIRNAAAACEFFDAESYMLLWELLILLIRQNGMVVGADIAELLMKNRQDVTYNRPASAASTVSSAAAEISFPAETNEVNNGAGNSQNSLREEVVTNKFREYLIYGSGKEALEWAMKHGLWGHALFLASKLDKRTYANVMMRFANGLTMNDPLQTLYQLLSGRLPAAVTSVVDEKWGDWRPHLAMILSNTTQRPELDRKAITTLGDTLFNRGSLYAAQFCYLMADIGFSQYGAAEAKLVLLGSNHNKPFKEFATNEAMHMTEIYEYACSLNDSTFFIAEFQQYKYLLATRLADRGLPEKALSYLENISRAILQQPNIFKLKLINSVCLLADRLKYNDPIEDLDESLLGEGDVDTSRPGNSWLRDLKTVQDDFNQLGLISQENAAHLPKIEDYGSQQQENDLQNFAQQPVLSQETWQQQQQSEVVLQQQQQWRPEQVEQPNQMAAYQQFSQPEQTEGYNIASTQQYQDPNNYWANNQQQQQQQWLTPSTETSKIEPDQQQQQPTDYWNNAQIEDAARPQISMPNQSKGKSYFEDYGEKNGEIGKETSSSTNKPNGKADQETSKQEKPSTGWFGGIFSKLALKPKNQMKLPDDKNPTIVWDQEKKRWVNLEEENNESANELKPPPKMAEMFPKIQQQQPHQNAAVMPAGHIQQPPLISQEQQNYNNNINNQGPVPAGSLLNMNSLNNNNNNNNVSAVGINETNSSLPPKPSQPNMFKMQRNRNLKKSYIDVFNPNSKSQSGAPLQTPEMFGNAANSAQKMNFFVPQPIADPNAPTDFLTPAPAAHFDENNAQASTYQ